jgi:hypothetical protein
MAWTWNDPSTWFQGDPPPPPPQPAPDTMLTPAENAQQVISKYWKWQAAGAKTVDTGQKDAKGAPIFAAADPATGLPDPDFPTTADITAARAEVAAKVPNDPAAVAQATATLNETLKRTEAIQANIDAAKVKPARPNVTPGEGVWDPTANGGAGGYTVPVPTKAAEPRAPSSTQANIDARDAADIAHQQALTGAVESPAQAYARQVAAATATARAQGQAKIDEAKALVDSGITMTEEQKARLTADLAGIQSDHDAQIATLKTQYDHDLAQPNLDRAAGVAQQGADAQTANAASNAAQVETQRVKQAQDADQANRNAQIGVLGTQAAQGQANVDRVVKAGSATPMSAATFRMASDPLQLAFQLAHQAVATGQLPPTAIPTPAGAPAPAAAAVGPPSAPLPAPGVVAPTQPTAPLLPPGVAGTAADPRYASVMPPQGAY